MIALGNCLHIRNAVKRFASRCTQVRWASSYPKNYLGDPSFLMSANVKGVLPAGMPRSLENEIEAILFNLNLYATPLAKYCYLRELQDTDRKLFYKLLREKTDIVFPLVYTPTVGDACVNYSVIFRRPKGLFLNIRDHKGSLAEIITSFPKKDIRCIVVTDGERVLGLGDLGAHGMGISVAKMAITVGLAGVPPDNILPVALDVGTDNETLLRDTIYIGLRRKRVRGDEYKEFLDEFMEAVVKAYGDTCVVQFEDFNTENAFTLLDRYSEKFCMFNDDIQGSASVCVAGVIASLRLTDMPLKEYTFLFQGAGAAALGISDLLVDALKVEGLTEKEACNRIWLVDINGVLSSERSDLSERQRRFAKDVPSQSSLLHIIKLCKPNVLIGASASPDSFTTEVLRSLLKYSKRPVVFALSNPTNYAECSATDVYYSTDGRGIFASGSPFPSINLKGRTLKSGQCNNAFVHPGLLLAALACEVTRIPKEAFLVAAQSLANMVTKEDLACGMIYPRLALLKSVSFQLAVDLSTFFFDNGYATVSRPPDITKYLEETQYDFFHPSTLLPPTSSTDAVIVQ